MEGNIRFGPPKDLEPWQSFDKHPLMKKLPEKIQDAMKSLWGLQNKVFKYKPSFIFSELTAERDNIPQKAHMDYNSNVMKWKKKNFNCYSCVGITPIHLDWCMVLVWTKGLRKKFRTAEEIQFDDKRSQKNIDPKPGQYYLYISKGIMVIFPGNTIHAVFLFWLQDKIPKCQEHLIPESQTSFLFLFHW